MLEKLNLKKEKKKKVLLVMPAKYGIKDVNLPLYLLFIAKPLLEHGYEPVIFDCRIKNYKTNLKNLDDFICVGITTMSGEQIKYALEVSKHIRKINPGLKIIWGGPHPSSMPEQTAANQNVDIVVKGEGEETIIEIIHSIEKDKSIKKIKGLSFKDKNGKIISTSDRPLRDINKSVDLPYHLLNIKKNYLGAYYRFGYVSSKGCPHRCGFCSNECNYGRKWVGKSPKIVVEELDKIIKTFHPKRIVFLDSNFFVDRKRIEDICNLIIKKRWDVEFYAMVRCDYLVRYTTSFFRLLKKANFKELAFGAESGDDRILNLITKDITVKQIVDSVKILKKNGFIVLLSLMMGFPSETESELNRTLDVYDKIKTIDKNARINGLFIFTPFPRNSLTNLLIEKYHYKLPEKLEDWTKEWGFNDKRNITWINKKLKSKYEGINVCARIMFINQLLDQWSYKQKIAKFGTPLMVYPIVIFNRFFNILAKIRWKLRFFNAPLDLRLWQLGYSKTKGMS